MSFNLNQPSNVPVTAATEERLKAELVAAARAEGRAAATAELSDRMASTLAKGR